MSAVVVFRGAEVDGRVIDVVVEDGRVRSIVGVGCGSGDVVIEAGRGALIPGLHDHHIHLVALAAARSSVNCGPPVVRDRPGLETSLRAADAAAATGAWIRGVRYHESVAGDLDRGVLDEIVADRPCRVQHRSGHGWVLNTAALRAAGVDGGAPSGVELDASGRPTGRIYGLDEWLRARVPSSLPDLAAVGADLAAFGVTGVTDATPMSSGGGLALIAAAQRRGELRQRVVVTGSAALPADAEPSIRRGPVKVMIADHALPALAELVGEFRTARSKGRALAVHCVTREALVLALAAWDEVGAASGDRIEHGAVVPLELAAGIAERGLTVVTQPGFVACRGDDYLADVDPDDRGDLWRCATLRSAGVPVGFGTDAPFGDPDPWRSITAAVERRTPSGVVLGRADRIAPGDALGRFLSPLERPGAAARRIEAGVAADLCLLRIPLSQALAEPASANVRLTMRDGAVIHDG